MKPYLIIAVVFLLVAAEIASTFMTEGESESAAKGNPESFGMLSDDDLKVKFEALDVHSLHQPEGSFKVLVFKLPKLNDVDSDFRIVFYKKLGESFVRHGAEGNLLNFQRPRLSTEGLPRVEAVMNRLGVRYHFAITPTGVDMVPSESLRDDGSLQGHPP